MPTIKDIAREAGVSHGTVSNVINGRGNVSVEKIQDYVEQRMAGEKEMLASDLPIGSEDDFIRLIYVRLYGQRKNMGYDIETLEEREVNGFRFRDFRIRRKVNGNSGRNASKRKG